MGEDFEVDDFCPRCGSSRVDAKWDELGLVRVFLHCKNCMYIEATNKYPETTCGDCSDLEAWQTDPDAWKNQ